MLLNLSESLKTPKNLQGVQLGIVVFNNDPRGLGRVKCVVAGLIEGRLITLPWIFPWAGGGSKTSSDGEVPQVGDTLTIEFKFDDIYSGFYTGNWKTYATASGIYNENYPDMRGSIDESGNQLIVNKAKGYVDFIHSTGTHVQFDPSGNLNVIGNALVQFSAQNNLASVVFDLAKGNVTLTAENTTIAGNAANITSAVVNIATGSLNETVAGNKTVQVAGGASDSIGGGYSRSVVGNSSEVVAGSKSDMYGQQVTRTYGLGYSDTVVLGNAMETLIAGNKSIIVTLGNMTYSLAAGSYSVNLAAGNITIQTLVGLFTCGNTLASIAMDPSGGMTIKAVSMINITSTGPMSFTAGANMSLKAPIIGLNQVIGGMVLTSLSSPIIDSITGAPSIGIPTVLAG